MPADAQRVDQPSTKPGVVSIPRTDADHRVGLLRRLARRALGLRLFWKILGANALLLAAALGIEAWLVSGAADDNGGSWLIVGVGVGAIVLSLVVNALLLWIALRPLRELERAADRVAAGDLEARAPVSPLADPDLRRLIGTMNSTLDRLLSHRARLREMAARALNTAEEERLRVARELHDDTAQRLAMLLVRLRSARTTSDERKRDALLDEVRTEIAESAEHIRATAEGLRPPSLDMLGLVPAVSSLAREVERTTGIAITVEGNGVDAALSRDATLALYRIVQEALSNVARHSGAEKAEVSVRRVNGRVYATVRDDGEGFRVDEVMQDRERGLGLFGMGERAAYLGGSFRVVSRPGEGTRVEVEIPVEGEEKTDNG